MKFLFICLFLFNSVFASSPESLLEPEKRLTISQAIFATKEETLRTNLSQEDIVMGLKEQPRLAAQAHKFKEIITKCQKIIKLDACCDGLFCKYCFHT